MAVSLSFSPFLRSLAFSVLLFVVAVSGHGGGAHDDDADAGADQAPDLRSKGLIVVKVLCLVIVFFATFVGGISPYFCKWNEGFLLLGTQFAGGVFLGTAMMHFLADSNETFESLTTKAYPFAFMLACFGYLLTMLADCIIVSVYGNQTVASGQNIENGRKGANELKGSDHDRQTLSATEANENDEGQVSRPSILSSAASLGDSVLLIVALCFHSVFEGIAIGVAENKAGAWRALWTVTLHKIFAAIAMGIALLRMIPDRPLISCAAYAFAFAISSPIGVAIGIVIDATTQGRVADWIYAISMGLACGVFIYVSINHLFVKGYNPQKPTRLDSPFKKFLAVFLGIGVMAVVMIWD